jgi:hypothetical protein
MVFSKSDVGFSRLGAASSRLDCATRIYPVLTLRGLSLPLRLSTHPRLVMPARCGIVCEFALRLVKRSLFHTLDLWKSYIVWNQQRKNHRIIFEEATHGAVVEREEDFGGR